MINMSRHCQCHAKSHITNNTLQVYNVSEENSFCLELTNIEAVAIETVVARNSSTWRKTVSKNYRVTETKKRGP